MRGRATDCQGDGQATAAGAEIQPARRSGTSPFRHALEELPAGFGEEFGLRTGNEDITVDDEVKTTKAGGGKDVLQRFAPAAADQEFAEGVLLFSGKNALEIQVQFHAGSLEDMREQQFGVQARGFNAFFGEKINPMLDGLQDGHEVNKVKGRGPKFKMKASGAAGCGGNPLCHLRLAGEAPIFDA
jgi:hypothetical protein